MKQRELMQKYNCNIRGVDLLVTFMTLTETRSMEKSGSDQFPTIL